MKWIHWLDVVMTVKQDGRRPRGTKPFAIDDRMTRRLFETDVWQADATQLVRGPFGAFADVALVLRQGADARDGEIPLHLVDVAVTIHIDEVDNLVHVFCSSLFVISHFPG